MGARLQGRRIRAARADPRSAHGRRAVADPGPPQDLPAPSARWRGDRRLDGDHRRTGAPLPDPPLYPEDPAERRRALELEDFFDEELGPHARLLAFHEATKDPATVERFTIDLLPGGLADIGPVRAGAMRFFSTFTGLRYGVKSDRRAELARAKIVAAFDRLESELGSGDYLVGDRFTVADLTAASLLYPLVRPPEGPVTPPSPEGFERFRAPLKDRPGYAWVERMFADHRHPAGASDEVAVDAEVPAG